MRRYFVLSFLSLCFLLCACSPLTEKYAACRALKSKIIFRGGTSDTRRQVIENAEYQLDRDTFDCNECECLVQKKHKTKTVTS